MTQPKIDHLEVVPGHPESLLPATIGGVACTAFTLKAGWVQDWDKSEGNRGPNGQFNERAELAYAAAPDTEKFRSPYNVREGMTQTYDVDYWFGVGFPPHVSARHEWAVLTQFHPQPAPKGIKGFGGATCHDGAITFESPTGDGSVFAKMPIKADGTTKHSIRMGVKWSAGKDGYAVIQDRATGKILGRYDGPTIAPGEWKSLKQGYYRAGGLPDATVYETLLDISEGDLTVTAPAPTPTPAQLDAGATQLAATVAQLRPALATVSKALDDAQAFLDKLK